VGISAEERRRLGDLPRGRGILGAVSRDATALRLDAIYEDPRSVGFPPGHPPMQSFLGVSIVVREAPFGSLCLTERRDGPFTAQDAEAFALLVAQAGVVLEHARMVEASRRWSEQLEALADVASPFTREIDVESSLNVIADQLLAVVDARSVVIEPLEPGGQLRAAVVAGDRAERVVMGAVAPAGSKARRVLGRRRSERVGTTLDDPEIDPHGAAAKLGIRSGCGSPWSREEGRLGFVTIADKHGTDAR
jgi:GAF domain-containing protein